MVHYDYFLASLPIIIVIITLNIYAEVFHNEPLGSYTACEETEGG